jgi:hypothetical protein
MITILNPRSHERGPVEALRAPSAQGEWREHPT